jgi:hypothetical protein
VSYNITAYSSAQQGPITLLMNKSYGVPDDSLLSAYVAGNFVTAALFNLRNEEIRGILAYLEDTRRDESDRAVAAEQLQRTQFGRIFAAAIGAHWIMTSYTGTMTGGVNLTLQAGEVAINGLYCTLPTVNYMVSFTNATNQYLVAKDDGTLRVTLATYTPTSHEVVVGNWNGTTYTAVGADTSIAAAVGGGSQAAHKVFAGPTSGADQAATFRLLVKTDMPAEVPLTDAATNTFQHDVQVLGTFLLSTNQLIQGSAPPGSGAHVRGDVVLNNLPARGLATGWTCIADGTPGTWAALGYLPNFRTVTANATVQNDDVTVHVNGAGPVAITLPGTWDYGKTVTVKDISGNASTNNITFVAGGSTTLEPVSTISADYASRTFYLDGTVWRIK